MIKDNVLISIFTNIMIKDNLVIIVDIKNKTNLIGTFFSKDKWNYLRNNLSKDFGVMVYEAENLNKKDGVTYLGDTNVMLHIENKYLIDILSELLYKEKLTDIKKFKINDSLVFNDWKQTNKIIMDLYNSNNLGNHRDALEKIYQGYIGKISENTIGFLLNIHKEYKLSSTSLENFLENHKEYLNQSIESIIKTEFPNVVVPISYPTKVKDNINIYVDREIGSSLLDWIIIDAKKLKEKYPFKVMGSSVLKLDHYQKMINKIITKNSNFLNIDFFKVDNFKMSDTNDISVFFKKKTKEDMTNTILYFIENYINEIEKFYIGEIEKKSISAMGRQAVAIKILDDFYEKMSETNEPTKNFILTSIALKTQGEDIKPLNEIVTKKIKI